MSVLALGSAKGSPGVTTAAIALAGSWPPHREALLVEADRAGGDLVARFASLGNDNAGVRAEPSTVQLAAGARGGLSERLLLEHLQRLPGSGEVRALVAPSSAYAAATALSSLVAGGLAECLSGLSGLDVLVDVGRLDVDSVGTELVRAVGEVVLVTRPLVTSVVHTRDLAASLRQLGVRVSLLIVGDSPYSPAEVGHAVGGLAVIGVLADDPAGAAALDGTARTPKVWARSRLVRSAAAVADRLTVDQRPPEESAGPALTTLAVPSPVEFSGAAR
ncbi:MAG: hypothetical protein MUE36_07160 [Acidimicrobiales bacterium]|nr:hypothetical protein [Acidimicrobiales bacterium]